MNINDEEEVYLNEEIDENNLDLDPAWIIKESYTEEDKAFVREQRRKDGITNHMINKEIRKINADSSNYYDDEHYDSFVDDKEEKSKAFISIKENKTIIAEEMKSKKETAFQEEISIIDERSVVKRYQNQHNTYNQHLDQVNKNQLKTQRTYDSNISTYQNQKNIDEYKENDKKEQLTKIEIQSKNLLNRINEDKNHLKLWRYKDKYYCKVCDGIIVDNVEDGITIKEIEKKFRNSTKIVEIDELVTPKTQNITQSKLHQFILLNHIPVVSYIVFNPKEDEFFEQDGTIYKNTFKYTKYLKRRRYGY